METIKIKIVSKEKETEELRKCPTCHSTQLLKYFKINRKGKHNKTCLKCSERNKIKRNKNKCEHGRQRHTCKDCGGKSICIHRRRRHTCKDCGGKSICIHRRVRHRCKDCGGGSVCIHRRVRSVCKDCQGNGICIHKTERRRCKDCDPNGHLTGLVRCSVSRNLKSDKSKHSIEYLGCDIETFKKHIEKSFKKGMTWENIGEWQIDHITPMKYREDPEEVITLEMTIGRLHYTNTQALWKAENTSKGNRYCGDFLEKF